MKQRRPILVLLALVLAYAVLFTLRPDLDLQLHRHLYAPGEGFLLAKEPFIVFFYDLIPWVTSTLVAGCILLLLYRGIKQRAPHLPALFVLLSIALGPGLVVNGICKEFSGRARPSQIEEFGGTKRYTPPLMITDQCVRNCSFVSGHASMGFVLAAFALFFTGWKRTLLYSAAVAFGLWVGFVRMAMGGHFFSDVIFAGLFTLLVVHLTYYAVFERVWRRPSVN